MTKRWYERLKDIDTDGKLKAHQQDAVQRLSNGKILVGGVGSGKSRTALVYYLRHELPAPIFVITTARKRDSLDWEQEASNFSIANGVGGIPEDFLRVDSWNNIEKYVDQSDAFFIFDEQRTVGSGTWSRSFLKIARRNRWVVLSGTPGDAWTDYVSIFIANGFYKNRTEFKNKHLVYSYFGGYPKLERILDVDKLTSLRSRVLVEMAFERHTTRHLTRIQPGFDTEKFNRALRTRQNPDSEEPFTNASDLISGLRRITNEAEPRIREIRRLRSTHPRLIVFYNFDYELDILRGLDGVVKEWNGHKHEPVPEGKSWVYLVQYMAGAEAWNCTTTDAMVFYSLTYSYKTFEQAQGRIDRMNTPFKDLYYYVMVSDSQVDKSIWQALERKEEFNESAFARGLK